MTQELTYDPKEVTKWLQERGFQDITFGSTRTPIKWKHYRLQNITLGVQQEWHYLYPQFWLSKTGRKGDTIRVHTFEEMKIAIVELLLEP